MCHNSIRLGTFGRRQIVSVWQEALGNSHVWLNDAPHDLFAYACHKVPFIEWNSHETSKCCISTQAASPRGCHLNTFTTKTFAAVYTECVCVVHTQQSDCQSTELLFWQRDATPSLSSSSSLEMRLHSHWITFSAKYTDSTSCTKYFIPNFAKSKMRKHKKLKTEAANSHASRTRHT